MDSYNTPTYGDGCSLEYISSGLNCKDPNLQIDSDSYYLPGKGPNAACFRSNFTLTGWTLS
jgi:hypothetical protein